jgi:hypothetical protein
MFLIFLKPSQYGWLLTSTEALQIATAGRYYRELFVKLDEQWYYWKWRKRKSQSSHTARLEVDYINHENLQTKPKSENYETLLGGLINYITEEICRKKKEDWEF